MADISWEQEQHRRTGASVQWNDSAPSQHGYTAYRPNNFILRENTCILFPDTYLSSGSTRIKFIYTEL